MGATSLPEGSERWNSEIRCYGNYFLVERSPLAAAAMQ
jgi:hypothetical protein